MAFPLVRLTAVPDADHATPLQLASREAVASRSCHCQSPALGGAHPRGCTFAAQKEGDSRPARHSVAVCLPSAIAPRLAAMARSFCAASRQFPCFSFSRCTVKRTSSLGDDRFLLAALSVPCASTHARDTARPRHAAMNTLRATLQSVIFPLYDGTAVVTRACTSERGARWLNR